MRAAVMRDRKLVVADVPVPEPGPGEVLVQTLACGICGSDLHALKHAGVPGVLDQLMAAAPRNARIVVVGVCMEPDTIYPMLGVVKELSLQFVLGYTQEEFVATLEHIADGRIPVAPLITGRVGIDGIAGAFEALASPERHAKIIVRAAEAEAR